MFAIIADGGRQYYVQKGTKLDIDLREGVEVGGTVTLGHVLLANAGGKSTLGTPDISGATVQARVIHAIRKGEKIEIQKFRRRKNYRRHTGHRQKFTTIEILDIAVPGLETVKSSSENA